MGKPVGTRCVQKFNCKWLGPGQMTSFYTLSVSKGNLLEPKKGKLVGSAADMTIEYLIDILTYIFV